MGNSPLSLSYKNREDCDYHWDDFNKLCVNFNETEETCSGRWIESIDFCGRFQTWSCQDVDAEYGCTFDDPVIATKEECEALSQNYGGRCSFGSTYYNCFPKTFMDSCRGFYYSTFDGCWAQANSPYECDFYDGEWVDRSVREECESYSICDKEGVGKMPASLCLSESCLDGKIEHAVYTPKTNYWVSKVINKSKHLSLLLLFKL